MTPDQKAAYLIRCKLAVINEKMANPKALEAEVEGLPEPEPIYDTEGSDRPET
jgi:hypothetical protein